jgi:hypothetical protein
MCGVYVNTDRVVVVACTVVVVDVAVLIVTATMPVMLEWLMSHECISEI